VYTSAATAYVYGLESTGVGALVLAVAVALEYMSPALYYSMTLFLSLSLSLALALALLMYVCRYVCVCVYICTYREKESWLV
jgi:hypothetical protein